jgi:hypothetical protein
MKPTVWPPGQIVGASRFSIFPGAMRRQCASRVEQGFRPWGGAGGRLPAGVGRWLLLGFSVFRFAPPGGGLGGACQRVLAGGSYSVFRFFGLRLPGGRCEPEGPCAHNVPAERLIPGGE